MGTRRSTRPDTVPRVHDDVATAGAVPWMAWNWSVNVSCFARRANRTWTSTSRCATVPRSSLVPTMSPNRGTEHDQRMRVELAKHW